MVRFVDRLDFAVGRISASIFLATVQQCLPLDWTPVFFRVEPPNCLWRANPHAFSYSMYSLIGRIQAHMPQSTIPCTSVYRSTRVQWREYFASRALSGYPTIGPRLHIFPPLFAQGNIITNTGLALLTSRNEFHLSHSCGSTNCRKLIRPIPRGVETECLGDVGMWGKRSKGSLPLMVT